jgi:hypothetical protein
VKLTRLLAARRRRRRRPREQAPREIVPRADGDPFDAARERLKRQIPPPPE